MIKIGNFQKNNDSSSPKYLRGRNFNGNIIWRNRRELNLAAKEKLKVDTSVISEIVKVCAHLKENFTLFQSSRKGSATITFKFEYQKLRFRSPERNENLPRKLERFKLKE